MTNYPDHIRIAQKLLDQQGDINRLTEERDGAYRERAQLLALLAALHPSVIAPAPDVDEDDWQILYLRIGSKQASWHIAPRDAELYAHVEHVPADDRRAQWDGHTTEQKYAHIGQHAARLYAEARGRAETPAKEQYRFATTWAEYHAGKRAALAGPDTAMDIRADIPGPVTANTQASQGAGVDSPTDIKSAGCVLCASAHERWGHPDDAPKET